MELICSSYSCKIYYSVKPVKYNVECHVRGGSRGRVQGVCTPPTWDDLRFSNTTGILQKKKTMWFIGVEVEQEMSAPPPKKNPGSAPACASTFKLSSYLNLFCMTFLGLICFSFSLLNNRIWPWGKRIKNHCFSHTRISWFLIIFEN